MKWSSDEISRDKAHRVLSTEKGKWFGLGRNSNFSIAEVDMMKYVFFNEYGNVIYEEYFNSDDTAAEFCDEVGAEYFCDEDNF